MEQIIADKLREVRLRALNYMGQGYPYGKATLGSLYDINEKFANRIKDSEYDCFWDGNKVEGVYKNYEKYLRIQEEEKDYIYVLTSSGILLTSSGWFNTREEVNIEYNKIKNEFGNYLEIVKVRKIHEQVIKN